MCVPHIPIVNLATITKIFIKENFTFTYTMNIVVKKSYTRLFEKLLYRIPGKIQLSKSQTYPL